MFNLLSNNIIDLFFNGGNVSMNWIAKLISGLVGAIGIVGIGVIVFTLILKVITLPLDIYSKASMRKNNLKMEKMRPQLEKLQKQYADNQQMYNQKMMEMYKKNGYSMFGACLPMIVSLVVFIIVLNAFSSYSKYMDVDLFNSMANDYSAAVLEYAPDDVTKTLYNGQEDINSAVLNKETDENGNVKYTLVIEKIYKEESKFISIIEEQIIEKKIENEDDLLTAKDLLDLSSDTKTYKISTQYIVETEYMLKDSVETKYLIETKVNAITDELTEELNKLKNSYLLELQEELNEEYEENPDAFNSAPIADIDADNLCALYMKNIGREAAEKSYHENRVGFLWVKNIWYPDTAFNHPIKSYKDLGIKGDKYLSENFYNEITYNLKGEFKQPNGYFILIVISIGTMFLSQFIMSKSQKAQNELQTANGQGAKTQKMMMIIMPVMFGIFSFMYSAAFSIYMIISSVWGIVSTLVINYFINKKYKKLEEKELQEKYNRRIPNRNTSDFKRSNKKR